ncbi:phosphopantetheine-binding protein [Pseudoalteromonas luteoviolacea]|uniref:Carrier domain-containing protein n=3 Tax=Pseudoalteromonas luteoviolacea TaxID=43657 RepID=A0A162AZN6_9GAMM|nr:MULTISPECIES: phosphopantetheine-binding protein [Pseudoalteromonas]KID58777.1 hypothetical protein JF50_02635 [Pseudoalteromonas luteoviolacea]KZN49816.1 hypothetical protein N476_18660 [Pseudoalteromonas luteoviolacea H33]KZN64240.1 hypothetical protein N473_14935 [Pseudoalteromonas luteoviolacea CPMOR-1]KZN77840.1 hypothetical protein N477_01115 [Pseudoalteromonas luteoviolacea H33-S]MBQ4879454.1 hypothetical protein [Pseudoalteromonas luteoviolacea]
MNSTQDIITFIKTDILIEELEVADSLEEIDEHAELVGAGLDLDSIELLDLVSAVEKKYGLKFKEFPSELVQQKMSSIHTLSEFISEQLAA